MRRVHAWSLVVLGLVACGDGVPRPAAVDPVSMREAEELAHKFEAAADPCKVEAIDPLLDGESLMRRAVSKADVPPAAKRGFLQGARATEIGQMLCQGFATAKDFHYDLLRVRDVGGQPRPIFRMLSDGAVNYHELELGKSRKDHRVRVLDVLIYTSGEALSDTFAGLLVQSMAAHEQGADVARASRTMSEVRAAQLAGNVEEMRRLIATLPPAMRDNKAIRLMELTGAADLDEATYRDLIDRFERSFPGDPALDLVSLDGFYLRKDAAGSLKAIERIDQKVGGDPYLDMLRASAHLLEPTPEHLAAAETAAKRATEALPDLVGTWWTLATVRLTRGDHAGVVPVLETLERDFAIGFDLAAMRSQPVYASFLGSPEFTAWWASRPR